MSDWRARAWAAVPSVTECATLGTASVPYSARLLTVSSSLPPWSPRQRRAQRWILGVAVALVLPSLAVGFIGDDYLQIAQLERWSPVATSPLDLYQFMPRDAAAVERLRQDGIIPYFAAPELKIAFLRPLTSALMWLDHTLFGRWPLPYHVHTLLWYGGLLLIVAALLRRTLPAGLSLLALAVFCLDDAHAMAAGWIAARNATVSCALVFLALWAHLRWRTEGWRPGAALSPIALALGLAGGETGLGALAYLFAWELLEGPRIRPIAETTSRPDLAPDQAAVRSDASEPAPGILARLRSGGGLRALAPSIGLAAIYLVAHRVTESGARASGGYLDPFGNPIGTLRELPARVLLLVGNLVAGAPIDLILFDPRMRTPLLVVGGLVLVTVAFWLPRALARMPADEARAVRWLGLGAAGALLVSVPALVGERVLMAASLGGSVVVAVLLRDAWRCLRARRARALAAVGVGLLALPNLVVAPVMLTAKMQLLRKMSTDYRRLAVEAEIEAPVPAQVLLVAMPDVYAMQVAAVRVFDQGVPPETLRRRVHERRYQDLPLPDRIGYRNLTVLSLSQARHRLRRTAADTLELFTPEGTLLDGAWSQTLRAPSLPLARGQVIPVSYMTATVLEDRAGRPTRVQLRFDRAVDDPSLVFLALSQGRLRRLALPPIGEEILVPQDPPLF